MADRKKKVVSIPFVIGILLILVLLSLIFVYYTTAKPNINTSDVPSPFLNQDLDTMVIQEQHVTFLLAKMGALDLRSSGGENPVIEVTVDEDHFTSEVIKGNISTSKGVASNPDLRIITTREEIIKGVRSSDLKSYFRDSFSSGKSKIEKVAGYSKLFSKGYVNLYEDMTGSGFTGSVIRVFS
jgi:hypothetical protein